MKQLAKFALTFLVIAIAPVLNFQSAEAACGTLTHFYDPSVGYSGTTLADQSGCSKDATIIAGTPVRTQLPARFLMNQGASGQYFFTNQSYVNPSTFSIAIWFRTTIAGGTKLMGFVQNTGTGETSYDRHLFVGTDGKLYYGIYNNATYTISTAYPVNDGKWHFAAATQSGSTGKLYIDTVTVSSNISATPQNYTGYWKVGGYQLTGWTGGTSLAAGDWVGDVGKVYIYSATALDATAVSNLYQASKNMYTSPSASLSAPGTTATYRSLTNIQLTSDVDGKATFYQSGKKIAGCISIPTTSGSVTCGWKPSVIKFSTPITAKLIPFDTATATLTPQTLNISVTKRTGNR